MFINKKNRRSKFSWHYPFKQKNMQYYTLCEIRYARLRRRQIFAKRRLNGRVPDFRATVLGSNPVGFLPSPRQTPPISRWGLPPGMWQHPRLESEWHPSTKNAFNPQKYKVKNLLYKWGQAELNLSQNQFISRGRSSQESCKKQPMIVCHFRDCLDGGGVFGGPSHPQESPR